MLERESERERERERNKKGERERERENKNPPGGPTNDSQKSAIGPRFHEQGKGGVGGERFWEFGSLGAREFRGLAAW